MIDAVLENPTQLQTVKPIYKTDIVYSVVTVVYYSVFILKLFIMHYERTGRRQKRLYF